MTGYMFKNAEYRLSLQQSLGFNDPETKIGAKFFLSGSDDNDENNENGATPKEEEAEIDPLAGKVKGKLRVRYGRRNGAGSSEKKDRSDAKKEQDGNDDDEESIGGVEMEVDAAAYMSELRSEVSQLRDELMLTRKEKEEALRKDLLAYIRTLPEKELRGLTSTMSSEVLVGMKGLVNAVMAGIGEGQIGPDTVTEQSGEAMAQLCMWQLVVGYNLRTLEVREEMKKSLTAGKDKPSSSSSSSSNYDSPLGLDPDAGPGAFE